MKRRKLAKLKRELEELRRGRHKALKFQSLASKLGRKENRDRGKEPMWESMAFEGLFPLAIPNHGGKDISPGVQHQLLDLLEEDIACWEAMLADEEEDLVGDEDDDAD